MAFRLAADEETRKGYPYDFAITVRYSLGDRSVTSAFTVENTGSADVHYRLYLENVEGALQEALTFSIYDGDKLLFTGQAKDFSKQSSCTSETPLAAGETRTLTAIVKMDESAGSAYQTAGITFDMTAEAVQAKNNPDRLFE